MLLAEFVKDFGIKKYFRTTNNIKYSLLSNYIQLVLEGDWIGGLEIPKDFSQVYDINKYFTQLNTDTDSLRFGDIYIVLSSARYRYGVFLDDETVIEQPNHLDPQHKILKYNVEENTAALELRGYTIIWLRPLNEKNIFPPYMLGANSYMIPTIAAMKAIDLSEGMIVSTNGYYSSDDGAGASYKIVTGSFTDDGGIYHLLNNGNFAKLIINSKSMNARVFGAKGDGIADDTVAIQHALDTKHNIFIPGGTYKITATLKPYRAQIISGEGNIEISHTNEIAVTSFNVNANITAFDLVPNIAIACSINNIAIIAIDQTTGSGAVGIKLGAKGTVGGSSQAIKCYFNDVFIKGFDIGFGIYGYSWEVTLNRCFVAYARTYSFDLADATTIVSLVDCSSSLGGVAYSTSPSNTIHKGYNIDGSNIYLYSPRAENSLNIGYSISNEASVTINNIYCEGNRNIDIALSANFTGNLNITGGVFLHDNSGVTTFAVIKNSSTNKCYINIKGVKYNLGKNNSNITTCGFYYAESTSPYVIIDGLSISADILKMSTGNAKVVYLSQAGRYAPAEFTVTDFPKVKFYQYSNTHKAVIRDSTPSSLLISDGTNTFDMLTNGSTAIVAGITYLYNSTTNAWAAV